MANDVPTIPLYQRPNPLIYKSAIRGMNNNPGTGGSGLEHRGVALEVVRPPKAG